MTKKIAIVTGGASGIGKAIAKQLIIDGFTVVIFDMNTEAIHQTVQELQQFKSEQDFMDGRFWNEIYGATVDITDTESIKFAMDHYFNTTSEDKLVVVNCAGISIDAPVHKMTTEAFKKVIDVNLIGTFNMCQAALPYMYEQKQGVIVNLASVYGHMASIGLGNYVASKHAVEGFTKVLAKEGARKGVRVVAVAPGFVETPLVANLKPEIKAALEAQTPLGRFAQPEEVANLVSFLVSDKASYCTGSVYEISGGLTL